MSIFWITTIGSGVVCFSLKYLGHSIPESWLNRPRVQRINTLLPIVLLSALVAVQTFENDAKLQIDQRLSGMLVAVIALVLRAPFPVVVLGSAFTSAMVYNFL